MDKQCKCGTWKNTKAAACPRCKETLKDAPETDDSKQGSGRIHRLVRPFSLIKHLDDGDHARLQLTKLRVIDEFHIVTAPDYNKDSRENDDLKDRVIYRDANGIKFCLKFNRIPNFRDAIYDALLLS